ncbi:MAG: Hsp20/alpha crystallin family protein [Calditrichaeota bacterium]|nr:Hsp20/alpha crystallin family protein [Calditrichota bacterium]
MALVRYEPFWGRYPFGSLQHRINRMFDDMPQSDEDRTSYNWSPRVEITEFEDRYELEAELPGLKKDDVKIELENNVLTISGEKSAKHEKKERKIHMNERVYGSFMRSFQVTSKIEADKINAEFNDGVLNLVLPKIEEEKPKQIQIKVK